MKTVPSLVALSTVGIAAAGLALGRPEDSNSQRPSSKKRKAGDVAEGIVHDQEEPIEEEEEGMTSPASRPSTSTTSTVIHNEKRPTHPPVSYNPQNTPPIPHTRPSNTVVSPAEAPVRSAGRRLSIFRRDESPRSPLEEHPLRESLSSGGSSWMRRLSTRPNSQNNSPRSSVGPDSACLTASTGSTTPFSSTDSPRVLLPPNVLVKRTTSERAASGGPLPRTRSNSRVPTLRRPATSHQRTVTLQQQFKEDSVIGKDSTLLSPSTRIQIASSRRRSTSDIREKLRTYFESRATKFTKERTSGRSSDGGIQSFYSTSRRVMPNESARPILVSPLMIITAGRPPSESTDSPETEDVKVEDLVPPVPITTVDLVEEPQKRARRSLSMHFSSPASWITRSGSLRGSKGTADGRSGGKRFSSAPGSTVPTRNIMSADGPVSNKHRHIMDPIVFSWQPLSPTEGPKSDAFTSDDARKTRSRNSSSSPLPPLSRLSSFNLDLGRPGLSSSSSTAPRATPNSPISNTNTNTTTSLSSAGPASPSTSTHVATIDTKSVLTPGVVDRASTLVGSDTNVMLKGFVPGDEDEMDFQSDTVFDSLRTQATGSMRSHNAPLESMFDESPPSLNGHVKAKRQSIHEMLANGGFQDGHSRIIEEDEDMSTPVKGRRPSQEGSLETPVRRGAKKSTDQDFPSSLPSFRLAMNDFSRLSLDDEDDDEDWTKDDENDVTNQLSPPSSSLNSRKVGPSFRSALADLTSSGSTNGPHNNNTWMGESSGRPVPSDRSERPKSNIFDWSEQSSAENLFSMGNSPRPKTAHVKQIADGRGSRAVGRRGPTALHIRSQSVPVVPDATGQRDQAKLPKFGTWGLGAKGVSEDWDADFEFGDDVAEDQYDVSKLEKSGMLVPAAIQASQASVVGHVGQIREVCLLVEDLKRLRLLAKEKGMLNGPDAKLWKEAEGIIALAVPEEEDITLSPPVSPSSALFDQEVADDRYHDVAVDGNDLSTAEEAFELLNRHGRPTGFVYDGHTVRRRSVFAPEDDIFGAGTIHNPPTRDHLRPPSMPPVSMRSSSDVARSVMKTMHEHRATSDPLLQNPVTQETNKMPFDTTSLRDLVHRANVLSRTLSDMVRQADGNTTSPEASPHRESSPAFTRVFTDPQASPPRHLAQSQSNNSMINGSLEASPTRPLGQRMHMMAVV